MKPREKDTKMVDAVAAAKAAGNSMIIIDDEKVYEQVDLGENEDLLEEGDDEDVDFKDDEEEELEDEDLEEEGDIDLNSFEGEIGSDGGKFAQVGEVDMNPDRSKRRELKKRRNTVVPPAPKRFIIDMSHVRHFVLDEVDRMFAMGNFAEIKFAAPRSPSISPSC